MKLETSMFLSSNCSTCSPQVTLRTWTGFPSLCNLVVKHDVMGPHCLATTGGVSHLQNL